MNLSLEDKATSSSGNGRNNSQRSLKDQEVAKEKAEDKAERRMMRHTDEVAHFGEMGVDALIVDELTNTSILACNDDDARERRRPYRVKEGCFSLFEYETIF